VKTNEAIEQIEHDLDLCLNDGIDKEELFKAMNVIKDKLKQGEAYVQIVEELEKELNDIFDKSYIYRQDIVLITNLIKELEQKYKEASK